MSEQKTSSSSSSSSAASGSASLTEDQFLHQQATDAKAALSAALSEAKAALADGIDPGTWARRYPFIAVGSALLAGFATAAIAIPSHRQQELKRIREIAEALRPEPSPKPAGKDGKKDKGAPAPWWTTFLKEGLNLIRPLLTQILADHLGHADQQGDEQHDGQEPPPEHPAPGAAAPHSGGAI